MILPIIYMEILLCSSVVALTIGAAISKTKDARRSLDELSCLTLSDGTRLDFQNKDDGYMCNKMVSVGERIELECQAFGAPQATIRWKRNGIFLDNEQTREYRSMVENGEMPVIGMGTTVSTLVIDCVNSKTAGYYTCVAENGCSEVIETSAVIAVSEADGNEQLHCPVQSTVAGIAPKIIFRTDSVLERPEAAVTLFCRATGNPQPEIEWFEETDDNEFHKIKNDENHLLLNHGDLLIRGKSKNGEKKAFTSYKCVATNQHGSDSMETIAIYATVSQFFKIF